jgi:uncharacterized OB-fold protein
MTTSTEYTKPLPTPSSVSQPFWDAAKEHRLVYQRCKACGTRVFYPRDVCPGPMCFGVGTLEWVESRGRGWVYAHTISYQPASPEFAADVPYVLAIIELDDGWRMNSNVINIDPQDVEIGMRVEVVWDDVTPEFTLPKFQPAANELAKG